MKRVLLVALVLMLALPAFADVGIDLSGLTIEQLVELRNLAQAEMMNRPQWQQVIVPKGVWKIGTDIPARHFVISVSEETETYTNITYAEKLTPDGKTAISDGSCFCGRYTVYNSTRYNKSQSIDLDLIDGMYLIVEDDPVVFTLYPGKPDLGFVW